MGRVIFKQAESLQEMEQVHALNHRIFSEEIGQHERHASGRLIDRFHAQNRYFIAVRDDAVVGMISVHTGPEFSVAGKMADASILRAFPRAVEVRLLAVEPAERTGPVLAGLLWQAYDFGVSGGFSHLLISGIAEREGMYRKLGFHALGPAASSGSASFLPMVMDLREQERANGERVRRHGRRWRGQPRAGQPRAGEPEQAEISLLPGPVCLHPGVVEAYATPAVSHRSPAFVERFEAVRERLKTVAGASQVALFPGAGTLANDLLAANLRMVFGEREGLVLSNGEFGERLARQAECAGLVFRRDTRRYTETWQASDLQAALTHRPAWIWVVHLETSTGVLNDVGMLLHLAREAGCKVALDCVSSLGAVALPAGWDDVLLLASGVSGKSLGGYAGLAMVYAGEAFRALANGRLPPSFDLLRMFESAGPVSTVPSSALYALEQALSLEYGSAEAIARRYAGYGEMGMGVRSLLRSAELQPLAADAFAAPNITTFALPDAGLPRRCQLAGFAIAHESAYLRQRGWGQIATMGDLGQISIEALAQAVAAPVRAV